MDACDTSKDTVSCAQALLASLADHGIDTLFGIPGIHTLDLYRGLRQTTLRHVAVRHEQGAAFMADGFARVAGRPAGCLLITGPGLLNASTAIGQAYSDSIPMMVITTVNDRRDLGLGRGEIHELRDQRKALEGVVDSVITVHDPEQVTTAVALSMARMGPRRKRPTIIELPLDVARTPVAARRHQIADIALPGPAPAALSALSDRLARAKRPFFIFGGGATGAAAAARKLVTLLGAPCATTVAGKGVVDETSPLSLGSSLGHEKTNAIMNAADLVIAVGTELAYLDHFNRPLKIEPDLIRIDLDADVLVRDHPPVLAILADAATALAAAVQSLAEQPARAAWRSDIAATRETIREDMRHRRPEICAYLDALNQCLRSDAAIFSDMTQIAYTANRYFVSREPGCWLHPVGFGTLGYAPPAAIGGKLADPKRQVVALVGDYGFGFTQQEIAVAVEQRLQLPIIIWNNQLLGAIDYNMRNEGIQPVAVDLPPPDFAHLAKAYGSAYAKVTRPDELGAAVLACFETAGPTLIEIVGEKGSYKR